jgi:survival-of-motor-neuron-related-splicing factor 30
MVAEIREAMSQEEAKVAPLREQLKALEVQLPKENAAPERKYDPEQHPLLKKTLEKVEPAKAVVFNTGDTIEARFFDGLWYKAKIMTILGSSSAPKYKINYVEYNEDATVDRDAIRPVQSKRKRDPEPTSAPAPAAIAAPSPVTSTPHVISGPASLNPKAQSAKQDTPDDTAEPKKRKIPNKKQLEQKVTNWKNWSSKGVGKKISQKDSMFRTGTNVNSRGELHFTRGTDEHSLICDSRLYRIWQRHDGDFQAYPIR